MEKIQRYEAEMMKRTLTVVTHFTIAHLCSNGSMLLVEHVSSSFIRAHFAKAHSRQLRRGSFGKASR